MEFRAESFKWCSAFSQTVCTHIGTHPCPAKTLARDILTKLEPMQACIESYSLRWSLRGTLRARTAPALKSPLPDTTHFLLDYKASVIDCVWPCSGHDSDFAVVHV